MKIDAETGEVLKEILPKEKPFLKAGYVEKSVSGRGYHVILNQNQTQTLRLKKF